MKVAGPDCPLATAVDGPEGAPWVVLSNSLGADMRMWEPQMPLLTRQRRVLRYDTRGHGQSGTAAGAFGFDALVADMVAVMDAHGVERADVVGLSLGGMTGLGLAIHHPDRLGRLVCADARADAPEPFRQNFAARMEKVGAGGMAAVVEGTVESWFTEDWRTANPEALEQVRAMIRGTDVAGYLACCTALQGLDYLKDLHRITAEVLYVGGDRDMGAPVEVMRAMAEATPKGRHVVIDNAAHVANINRPEAFDAALAEFLGLER